MERYKGYVDILSALLTPTIALVTTYIAVQQYRRERAKFRHDLYDRRMTVYKATSAYLSTVTNYSRKDNAEEELRMFREFNRACAESYFLFNKEVVRYLEIIQITGSMRLSAHQQLEEMNPEDLGEIEAEKGILATTKDKHLEQSIGLRDIFMKYLDLKNLK
jgi:hypothetical protein